MTSAPATAAVDVLSVADAAVRAEGYLHEDIAAWALARWPDLTGDDLEHLVAVGHVRLHEELGGGVSLADTPEQRARFLIVFADGFEDAGHPELARRSRMVARDVLDLAAHLAGERSARLAIAAERDRLRDLLAKRPA